MLLEEINLQLVGMEATVEAVVRAWRTPVLREDTAQVELVAMNHYGETVETAEAVMVVSMRV